MALHLVCPRPGLCARILDYDEVLRKAVGHSREIEMSRLDAAISGASLRYAKSFRYPAIKTKWNTEYNRDLTKSLSPFAAIGNLFITPNTMYQSSLSLEGTYRFFDFEATAKRISIAQGDFDAKRATHQKTIRDTALKVLDIYADILIASRELEIKRQLLDLHKEALSIKNDLYHNRRITRMELIDDEVQKVRTVDEINTLTFKIGTLYRDLGLYTGDTYGVDITVADLKEMDLPASGFDINAIPESKIYALEIKKKQAELDAIQREMLPRIDIYSNYSWYASHEGRPEASMRSIEPRSFSVGFAVTMPLFEGFRSSAEMEKARLEVDRLRAERMQKLAEISVKHEKLCDERRSHASNIASHKEMLGKINEKLGLVEYLFGQRAIRKMDFIARKAELLTQKLELTRAIMAGTVTGRKILILSGGETCGAPVLPNTHTTRTG